MDGNVLRTKQDAVKAKRKAIKMAQLSPLPPDKKTIPVKKTIREVFKEYCEKGRADRAYQTIRKQDSIWENHLDSEFGDKIIDEIPASEVNDYLAKLYYGNGYAYRYVESFIKMFYLIYGQAYSRGSMLPLSLVVHFPRNKSIVYLLWRETGVPFHCLSTCIVYSA